MKQRPRKEPAAKRKKVRFYSSQTHPKEARDTKEDENSLGQSNHYGTVALKSERVNNGTWMPGEKNLAHRLLCRTGCGGVPGGANPSRLSWQPQGPEKKLGGGSGSTCEKKRGRKKSNIETEEKKTEGNSFRT